MQESLLLEERSTPAKEPLCAKGDMQSRKKYNNILPVADELMNTLIVLVFMSYYTPTIHLPMKYIMHFSNVI